jgi:hypothetical protein
LKEDGSRKIELRDCVGSDYCGRGTEAKSYPSNVDSDNRPDPTLLVDKEGNEYWCTDQELCGTETFTDKKDVKREWFFPQVTIGFGVIF